jgi:hypothetical protein
LRNRLHLAHRGCERIQQVGPADDPHNVPPPDDWDALDPALFHQLYDVLEWSVFGYGHRVGAHGLSDFAAVRMGVFFSQPARPDQEFEPSRTWPLCPSFGAPKKTTFGDTRSGRPACQSQAPY